MTRVYALVREAQLRGKLTISLPRPHSSGRRIGARIDKCCGVHRLLCIDYRIDTPAYSSRQSPFSF